ncbi:hypothetical protein BpHYR1_021109 [Brachionus plicatilis]|uniref:Uncharacterized protein n=1 Tax=Brachionus plicatilis TaxID=10195 RepID=A0A3M7SDM5_BRAPC|nr:hypothetical protein BpHYR1_021109 [Brachionus plicatilis]
MGKSPLCEKSAMSVAGCICSPFCGRRFCKIFFGLKRSLQLGHKKLKVTLEFSKKRTFFIFLLISHTVSFQEIFVILPNMGDRMGNNCYLLPWDPACRLNKKKISSDVSSIFGLTYFVKSKINIFDLIILSIKN